MVVVKSREELEKYIMMGYKPYYHKAVARWYLRKGRERHIIARELELLAKKYAEELESRKKQEVEMRRKRLEEAVKLRSRGAPMQEVVERTGVPGSTLYRYIDETSIQPKTMRMKSRATQIQSRAPPKPPTPPIYQAMLQTTHEYIARAIPDLRKRLEQSEQLINQIQTREYRREVEPSGFQQKVYKIKLPRPRTNPFAPGGFLRMLEETLSLPPFPIPFRRDIIRTKCPGCGEELRIKAPEAFIDKTYINCTNCNSLIEIEWINEEGF